MNEFSPFAIILKSVIPIKLRGDRMAYFLKKTKLKNRTYLAIYESFYSQDKNGTAHKCYKSLGSVETLIKNGIEDPIAHFQENVNQLNAMKKEGGIHKISNVPPVLNLGYFPLKSIMKKLKIRKYINHFKRINEFKLDLYELLASLIYARSVSPYCYDSKFLKLFPSLYNNSNYSCDQLLHCLSFLGRNYEKLVELFTVQVEHVYGFEPSKSYFLVTNFFFEIDWKNDLKRMEIGKENGKNPIVGLGLFLDRNQLPMGMKMYPGSESKNSIYKNVVKNCKITEKTIFVTGEEPNCAKNIIFPKKSSDGYLFSKSIDELTEQEKVWVLFDHDFNEIKDNSGNVMYRYHTYIDNFSYKIVRHGKKDVINLTEKRLLIYDPALAEKKRYEINRMVEKAKSLIFYQADQNNYGEMEKYVKFADNSGGNPSASINQEAINSALQLAGYSLLITSETEMDDQDIYNTYHNLGYIQESFKIMKSELDAAPEFLQKEDTIKGYFLISYLTVLLERIFQFKTLENKYPISDISRFLNGFQVTKADDKYINTTIYTDFIGDLSQILHLPLTNCTLSSTQIKSIMNYKL